MLRQRTLQNEIRATGIGLHSGEKVELNVVHGRNLGLLKVDQSQLDTALINLSVNARDAMPDGGRLDIKTTAVTQPAKRNVVEDVVEPGRYVLIEVKDTGTGMPDARRGQAAPPVASRLPPCRGCRGC